MIRSHSARQHSPTSPWRLSDSHILKLQCSAVLDALEIMQALAHHLGAGLSVVARPSAEPGDDPGGKGERSFGMRIFLAHGVAFEFGRKSLEQGLIVRLEG